MIDTVRLETFLTERLGQTEPVRVLALEPISGGYNSSMTKVTVDVNGTAQNFTVRCDLPADRTVVAVDRNREWAILNLVSTSHGGASCPPIIGFDPDGSILGESSLVLEFVHGTTLQSMCSQAPPTDRAGFARRMLETGVRIHQSDLSELTPVVDRPSSWRAYIEGIIAEWRCAAEEYVEPDPFLRYTAAWLERHMPPEAPLGLVHGDFQSSNVLVDRSGETTTIDWEFAHVGDPREDLGWLLAIERLSPPILLGDDLDGACAIYRSLSGLDENVVNPDTVTYFSVLALGRPLRSVMQQARAFVEGANRSLVMPYARAALAAGRLQALQDMRRLAVSSSLTGSNR